MFENTKGTGTRYLATESFELLAHPPPYRLQRTAIANAYAQKTYGGAAIVHSAYLQIRKYLDSLKGKYNQSSTYPA